MPTIHAREMPIYRQLSEAPTAVEYGVGPAWIGGVIYWSDGETWISGTELYANDYQFSQNLSDNVNTDAGSHTKYPSVNAVVQYIAGIVNTLSAKISINAPLNVRHVGVVPLFVGSLKLQSGTYTPSANVGCTNAAYAASVLINIGPDTISTIGNVAGTVQWRTGETFILSGETDIDIYLVANSVSATAELHGVKL